MSQPLDDFGVTTRQVTDTRMADTSQSEHIAPRGPLTSAEISYILEQARLYLEQSKKVPASTVDLILTATRDSLEATGKLDWNAVRRTLERELPKSEANRIVESLAA